MPRPEESVTGTPPQENVGEILRGKLDQIEGARAYFEDSLQEFDNATSDLLNSLKGQLEYPHSEEDEPKWQIHWALKSLVHARETKRERHFKDHRDNIAEIQRSVISATKAVGGLSIAIIRADHEQSDQVKEKVVQYEYCEYVATGELPFVAQPGGVRFSLSDVVETQNVPE